MSPRLFLVDDDDAVVSVVGDGVRREKWEFQASGMISGVMEAVRSFVPDIVLLDVNLPDGEGYEICRQMRAEALLEKIPVIFLTVKGNIESRLKGFAAGAQDYVVKPFNLQELLARIRAHLTIKDDREVLEHELSESHLHERVRQDVVDMIVHDLRSPITTAKITLELLRGSKALKKPYSDYLQCADSALDFTMIMVNDMLDLDAGKVLGEASRLDLGELCGRLEKMFAVQYQAKKVSLAFDVPKKGTEFSSDPALVFRILANLLGNSLKFSSPQGKVLVRARAIRSGVRIEVIDSGTGIPDSEKESVFLKFYRGKNAQAGAVPGCGIGLAFCRLATEALRGRIWIEDAKGGGSRFIIELPSIPPGTKLAHG